LTRLGLIRWVLSAWPAEQIEWLVYLCESVCICGCKLLFGAAAPALIRDGSKGMEPQMQMQIAGRPAAVLMIAGVFELPGRAIAA